MKALGTRDPFRIGVVAIAVGGLVGGLIVLASALSFGTRDYTAVLEHTAGLRVGEDVQVSGVSVGEVRDIELVGGQIRVGFALDDAIELGPETTAAVKVATLLGTHYLEVDPAGEGRLEDDTIPLARTTVPFNLQDVLEGGSQTLEELDGELLARALDEVGNTLRATDSEIGPALEGVTRLSQVISRRSAQAGDLLEVATEVTDRLADDTDDIVGLVRQTNLVVSEVTVRRDAIRDLLRETTRLSESLTAIVTETEEDVRPALRDLNRVLDTLRRQDQVLRDVLDKMAPAVRYVANAAGNGPWVDLFLQGPALPADDTKCSLGSCG